MDRQRERDELLERLNDEWRGGWPYCEYDVDLYLHIAYDDFDEREELMLRFRCMGVVDYLLSILDRENVKTLLIDLTKHPGLYPLVVMTIFSRVLPEGDRYEILDTIRQIYHSNSMDEYADVAIMAREMSLRSYYGYHATLRE